MPVISRWVRRGLWWSEVIGGLVPIAIGTARPPTAWFDESSQTTVLPPMASLFFGGFGFAQPPTVNKSNNCKTGGRAKPRPSGSLVRLRPPAIAQATKESINNCNTGGRAKPGPSGFRGVGTTGRQVEIIITEKKTCKSCQSCQKKLQNLYYEKNNHTPFLYRHQRHLPRPATH